MGRRFNGGNLEHQHSPKNSLQDNTSKKEGIFHVGVEKVFKTPPPRRREHLTNDLSFMRV